MNNDEIGSSLCKLENKLIEKYGHIEYDFKSITTEEKEKIIEHYKKINNKKDEDIHIEDVIALTNQCKTAIYYYKNQKILYDNFNDNLVNMTINNKKIITPLEIIYKKKINFTNLFHI